MLYTLAYDLTGHGLPEIGRQLGRDHTTILHGIRKFRELCDKNPVVLQTYRKLRYELPRM
jgi:chromosomal replication initiator protein